MADSIEDRVLVELWRAGDQSAARKIFDTYVERLVALARKRLNQRMARRVDPEDVVQSVFRTFFGRVKAGQFHIEDQDDLCKLLMRITVHKTLRSVAFHQAAKRDAGHEVINPDSTHDHILQLLDREPSPDETVAFLDQLEQFLAKLRPDERQILELRLQGLRNDEIAQQLNTYDRKIRRVLERIRGIAEVEGV